METKRPDGIYRQDALLTRGSTERRVEPIFTIGGASVCAAACKEIYRLRPPFGAAARNDEIGGASVCGAARDKAARGASACAARKKDTAYGCVLGVFGYLSWRREGSILGFVDVPVGGHLPNLPSPRKTLAADAKTSLAFLASWR